MNQFGSSIEPITFLALSRCATRYAWDADTLDQGKAYLKLIPFALAVYVYNTNQTIDKQTNINTIH